MLAQYSTSSTGRQGYASAVLDWAGAYGRPVPDTVQQYDEDDRGGEVGDVQRGRTYESKKVVRRRVSGGHA
eukprot:2023867-Rhodomonas_salina.3